MTDTADLTLKLLRKIDARVEALDAKIDSVDAKLGAFRDYVEMRFSVLEHTVNALAGQVLAFAQFAKSIDARVRRLEGRPAK